MGQISTKLAARLKRSRKLADELRREARSIPNALEVLQHGGTPGKSRGEELAPLHSVYIAAQNVPSLFAERVSGFPEFKPYSRWAAGAEDESLPDGPPMSPLTRSY